MMHLAVAIGTATAAAVAPTTARATQRCDGPIGTNAYKEKNYDSGKVHFPVIKMRKAGGVRGRRQAKRRDTAELQHSAPICLPVRAAQKRWQRHRAYRAN